MDKAKLLNAESEEIMERSEFAAQTSTAAGMSDKLMEFSTDPQKLEKSAVVEELQPSLFRNTKVPALWRYLIPVVLVADIALFLVANLSVGATVAGNVGLNGHPGNNVPIKAFSLGNSVKDMWDAGVYPLSLLIAVFSGAWPYIKLFAMLGCWLLSEQQMNHRWRERFLIVLDTMGKWSKSTHRTLD